MSGVAASFDATWLVLDPSLYAMGFARGPLPFIACGVLLAGTLYFLRVVRRDAYSAIEVGVGLAMLWFAGSDYSPTKQPLALLSLIGAVYVLIRGATNIYETTVQRRAARQIKA